jgi:hypothetical protein
MIVYRIAEGIKKPAFIVCPCDFLFVLMCLQRLDPKNTYVTC